MPQRKRRFETLEERRLLSVVAAAQTSAAASPAAEIAPSARPEASAAADASDHSPVGDSTDDSAEYGYAPSASGPAPASYPSPGDGPADNAAGNASSSTSQRYGYVSPTYDNSYASSSTTSTPYYSTKQSSTPLPSSRSSGEETASVPALQVVNSNLNQGTTADTLALLLPNSTPAPAASGSAPAARSPSSESQKAELQRSTSIAEPVASPTTEDAETLMAPVAQSDSPGDWHKLSGRTAAVAEWLARAEPLLPVAEAAVRSLLIGSVGAQPSTLEDGIDAVFERFDGRGIGLTDHAKVSRIGQWLVLAGGACAAFEYARARYREYGGWQAASAWPVLYEPRLRRRWFAHRSTRK